MSQIESNKVINFINALHVDGVLNRNDVKALIGYINTLGTPENPKRDAIKIRRGTEAQLTNTILDDYELGYTTDTQKLYIGTPEDENILLGQGSSGAPSVGATLPIIMPEDVVNPQIGQMIITSDTKRIMFYIGDGVWKMPGAIGY